MLAVEIIRRKRDGHALTETELASFVRGAATGVGWADYQLSAMLMAIVCRGMTATETALLTRQMTDSGTRLDLSDWPGIPVDKHSTGGVGDKTSLVLAPLVAACGAVVPMMSGRGLGHTGGTLDKLAAIPGFTVDLPLPRFREVLGQVGTAMIAPTATIAPADKTLYALRDVTGTVESLPLITASILSKKLAEGIGALVLDVKQGSGAFLKSSEQARALAKSLVQVGQQNGLRVEAILTDMEHPLGCKVGNLLEVQEAIDVLQGRVRGPLWELTCQLGVMMLRLAGVVTDDATGRTRLEAALASGQAWDRFERMVVAQGGRLKDLEADLKTLDRRGELYRAEQSGILQGIDAESIGWAAVELGAGRTRAEDSVDPWAGIELLVSIGEPVSVGQPLARLIAGDGRSSAAVWPRVRQAFRWGANPPRPRGLLGEMILP